MQILTWLALTEGIIGIIYLGGMCYRSALKIYASQIGVKLDDDQPKDHPREN